MCAWRRGGDLSRRAEIAHVGVVTVHPADLITMCLFMALKTLMRRGITISHRRGVIATPGA